MKAIPTVYRGVQFRSRLEARWAVFFDHLGIEWRYEPEGYTTAAGPCLPDFWLPHVRSRGKAGGIFFEVKGSSPTEGERNKARMLAWGSNKTVIVPSREPKSPDVEYLLEFVGGMDGWEDEGLMFARCPRCGSIDVGFYSSDSPLCLCGKAHYDDWDRSLVQARHDFQNYLRWEAAA